MHKYIYFPINNFINGIQGGAQSFMYKVYYQTMTVTKTMK